MPPLTLPAWTTGVRREILPNGLTLLVQRDRSAPVASVVTLVKAGFFDEPDRWVGISHVLEHMFFKGTPSRGPGVIARQTKAVGGYLNASTTYDHTSYFVVLPADRLADAIAIQADALMHAAIDSGELARELQVIIQEARRKLDTPSAVTSETLHEVLFDRHRIRRWRIGHEEMLAGFTRDDVAGYYHSRYVPGRTIVAIVGDVDVDAAVAMAHEAWGGWAGGPGAVDASPAEPARRDVRARTLRGDVTQAELVLGWRGVPPLDPDAIPLDLAAGILAAGRGSWLYRALRERGLASGVSAWHYAPTELGVFAIEATCDADRVAEVTEAIAQATTRLALTGPDPEDLDRARTLLLTRWSRRMEEMDGRAAALASAEALDGYGLLDREFAALAGCTADQVRSAAARVLDPESLGAVLYLPRDRGAELSEESLRRMFAVTTLAPPVASPVATAPPARPAGGAPGRPEVTAGVHHLALPGFDLLVRPKSGVPTVTLGVYLPRARFEPAGQAGLTALTVRSAMRGAGDLDAAALAFAFERLGGSLGATVGLDWLGLGATVLASRLPDAAALLALTLREPRFEPGQVEAERRLLVEETTRVTDDMFRYPFQLAFAAAYGEAGYGVPAMGLPGDLASLRPEAVAGWHREVMLTPRGVVIAVGDVEADAALAALSGAFDWGDCRKAEAFGPQPWALDGRSVERIVPRDKAQSAVAMVFPGPSRHDATRHAADVWAAVASGLGGRLFEALRDRRSLAYTVVASSWQKARSGAFVSYIATAPEREAEARAEMLLELRRFAEEPVAAEELGRAANYLAGQTAVNRQSGAAVAGEILEAWLAGSGLAELADPAAAYHGVTAEQVREVAARTLGGAWAEGIVRGSGGGR